MRKVIVAMTLAASFAVYGAYELYQLVPQPIATAVIGEKQDKILGGSAATLLPANLTTKQSRLLNLAYTVAKEEGIKHPEIIQSILLQETGAGGMKAYKVANPGPDAYFGPMQIKLGATRDVLSQHPTLWTRYDFHTRTDDEVKANLILNEEFNMRVAVKYVKLLQAQYGFTGRELVNAYNRGPGGVKAVDADYHYAVGAESKLAAWKGNRK